MVNDEKTSMLAAKLNCMIESIFLYNKKPNKIFAAFHKLRTKELVKLWEEFGTAIGEKIDPLLYQRVSTTIYEEQYKEKFGSCHDESTEPPALTTDEENVVRFTAGYVPMKLLRKYMKSSSPTSACLVDCLAGMSVDGPEESLLSYTTEWSNKIDRGGLFDVSDLSFLLFRCLEVKFRQGYLPTLQRPATSSSTTKQDVITMILEDEEVQFYWSMLALDIDEEDKSTNLLKDIVNLWLNIRGFSAVHAIVEESKETKRRRAKAAKAAKTAAKTAKKR